MMRLKEQGSTCLLQQQARMLCVCEAFIIDITTVQIERMQGDMDTVHNNMAQSERKLRSIESPFGTLYNQFGKTSNRSHKKKALAGM